MKFLSLALSLVTIAQLMFFWVSNLMPSNTVISCWGIFVTISSAVEYYRLKFVEKLKEDLSSSVSGFQAVNQKEVDIIKKHLNNAQQEIEKENKNVQQ